MEKITEFHRKYRPARLSEYIGNASIVNTALKFLPLERKPQVILLHGNSGCGKTTFARLLCSCYSCETPLENGDACGECPTCQEFAHYIETGDYDGLINIHEVDVTDDSGKRAVDELIDEMNAPSLTGGWKCFIFDECHLMTPTAQARLLKTIEEPPEKVLICLCTTNPEKLLDTIVSRCHYQFRVQKPKREELISLLQTVCDKEGIRTEKRALSLIATKGGLVPRNSLIELQKVVRTCGNVTYDATAEALNVIADKYYFTFYNLLTANPLVTYQYIGFIHTIMESIALSEFLDGLIDFTLRGIYVYNNVQVDGLEPTELKPYGKLFAQFSPGELVYLIEFLTSLRGNRDAEIKLLRLGYTGIKPQPATSQIDASELKGLNSLTTDVSSDMQAGNAAFQKKTVMTDAEREDIVKTNMAAVPVGDMLNMFGGVQVKINDGGKKNG